MSTQILPTRTFGATAFFDDRAAAEKAIGNLIAAGIPRTQISTADGEQARSGGAQVPSDRSHAGFWATLKDMFMPDEDRHGYAEGLRRGGTVVSVTVDEAEYDRALDILETDGVVDMDAREATWKRDGWSAYVAQAPGTEADATFGNGAIVAPVTGAALAEVYGLPSAPADGLARRDTTRTRVGPRGYIVDTAGVATEVPAATSPAEPSTAASIAPHMEVIASDGNRIGTVDHLEGADAIKLAKTTSPDGRHHLVPLDWVDHVDRHVHLSKTTAQVMSGW